MHPLKAFLCQSRCEVDSLPKNWLSWLSGVSLKIRGQMTGARMGQQGKMQEMGKLQRRMISSRSKTEQTASTTTRLRSFKKHQYTT